MPTPPPAQLAATRSSDIPITEMMVPVTTGGNIGKRRLMNGATTMPKMPAAMTAPKMPLIPSSGLVAIASIGPTAAKVTPIITGSRMPNFQMPIDWISVTMPAQSRSALMSSATWSFGRFSAPPMISGTATAPAYITSTCCRPSTVSWPAGRTSSTGCTPAPGPPAVPRPIVSVFDIALLPPLRLGSTEGDCTKSVRSLGPPRPCKRPP